ncbi:hypothetical protein C7S18_11935 [Ahniella affigens]|uniref:Uncharacterized protein n=1 Tax=Ahniella affigens TaxID=2021234 RepID=A0A2P1PSN8_9GAMM|nr:hypothetical protein C7S18_11935 [Ahniella affigens]
MSGLGSKCFCFATAKVWHSVGALAMFLATGREHKASPMTWLRPMQRIRFNRSCDASSYGSRPGHWRRVSPTGVRFKRDAFVLWCRIEDVVNDIDG